MSKKFIIIIVLFIFLLAGLVLFFWPKTMILLAPENGGNKYISCTCWGWINLGGSDINNFCYGFPECYIDIE